ncbi:histidine phosphatase family protein [Glycomyces luteolus]|uniref:Histidine phosphatase family protein n=1 Tax=Glycomyces luteolus TaxID=2670330 RepID=A0A9X3PDD4_9ACTN|nr:histidine phosphatase family protein [Glycomyces luteolus]MDA1362709.1 histidine phosphatase family protein [Glycomyces luteolus]
MTRFGFESVYLARHGQTQWNTEGRRQGRLDSPLTEEGRGQVTRYAERLGGEPIDSLFASPLGRASASAGIVSERLHLPIRFLDDLSEVDHGVWSGLVDEEIDDRWPGESEVRSNDKYRHRFPGGESYADASVRAHQALAAVERSGSRAPLLVSHEMIGRMLLKHLTGMDYEDALELKQPNEIVYRVDPDGMISSLA